MGNEQQKKDNVITFEKGNDPAGNDTYVNGRSTASVYDWKKQKEVTQNFIMMDDIIVPIITKKDANGNEFFALKYTYNPISNQIFLELPKVGIETEKAKNMERERAIKFDHDDEKSEKEIRVTYSKSDIDSKIEELLKILLLFSINGTTHDLTTYFDAVSASFTNSMVKYVELEVKNEQGDQRIKWFPISSLQDILSRDIPMSAATNYGLALYAFKHKDKLKQMAQISADINEELLDNPKSYFEKKYINSNKKQGPEIHHEGKNLYKRTQHVTRRLFDNKRFKVEEVEIPGYIQQLMALREIDYASGVFVNPNEQDGSNNNNYTMETFIGATSKDSIQCVIVREHDHKIQIAVQKNDRSPFFARLGKEFASFYEIVAGGIDPKDSENTTSKEQAVENAVKRELSEESGYTVKKVKKLIGPRLYSQGTDEKTSFYVAVVSDKEKPKDQQLDAEEHIGEIKWITLPQSREEFIKLLNELNSPVAKKLAILQFYDYVLHKSEIIKYNENAHNKLNKSRIEPTL